MNSDLTTPPDSTALLNRFAKPGRYAGNEFNTVRKDHRLVKTTLALAYPDLYDVGMSYYGFQILYHILNREKDIAAERVYTPATDYADYLRQNQMPLRSLESHLPLKDFDMIGVTLPYELTLTNIIEMLTLAHLPLLATDRNDLEPFIIGGGNGAFNPEPLAPFFDLFVIGDAEEIIVPLARVLGEGRRKRRSRRVILSEVAQVFKGIYVPQFYQPDADGFPLPLHRSVPSLITALKIPLLKPDNYPPCPIVPLVEIAQDRLATEVMRGCTKGCRFCQAGMLYRPVRERPPADILRYVNGSLAVTGQDEVALLSLSTSDYSALRPLLMSLDPQLRQRNIALSYPSLRLDSFSELLTQTGQEVRKTGLTFAPEAGSERLRRVINKQITNTDLLQTVSTAVANGWRLVKLYFMLGLPTETDSDLVAIYDLCREVLSAGGKRLNLNITLSTFIPKPFTPFQWESMVDDREIQRRLDLLKPLLRALKGTKVMARAPRASRLEAILARGDRRLANVIHSAHQKGARFEAWSEHFRPELWDAALNEHHLDPGQYLSERSETQKLPWEIIDCGVTRAYLLGERARARDEVFTPDCRAGCLNCGVCSLDGAQMQIVGDAPPLAPALSTSVSDDTPSVRYLIRWSKRNSAVFTSHLDVLRVFRHSLRRAGLEPTMTGGFHPQPKISAGLPLPTGYASSEEWLEITLKRAYADIPDRLNRVLPDGFAVQAAQILPASAPSVYSRTTETQYQIQLANPPTDLPEKIAPLLANTVILVARQSASFTKDINIRPFITNLSLLNATLSLTLKVINGRSVKVNEVIRALGIPDHSYTVLRQRVALTPLE